MAISKLLLLTLLAFQVRTPSVERMPETIADLNGDGKPEVLHVTNEGEQKVVRINASSITVKLPIIKTAKVVDISPNDGRKELFIGTHDLDFDGYAIFSYDGRQVKLLSSALVDNIEIPGNGNVYVTMRYVSTVWWTRTEKYEYKDFALVRVPQPFYSVNIKTKVSRSFPITYAINSAKKVADLAPGSQVDVLVVSPKDGCVANERNDCEWYLIRSSTNLIGWASQADVLDNLEGMWRQVP